MTDTVALSLAAALREAVTDAVASSSGQVVTALSGGVDSSFIAVLAKLPAVAAGIVHSHDLKDAKAAALEIGIPLTVCEITEAEVLGALSAVVPVVPEPTVMNVEIAVTEYFICRTAAGYGASALLTGQGADELFAGYARYGTSQHLREDLDHDQEIYHLQQERDRAVAALCHIDLLQPFMDARIIAIAKVLQSKDLVDGPLRKIALRRAAATCLPYDLAWLPKKAMQYGTGTAWVIERFARKEHMTPQELIGKFI